MMEFCRYELQRRRRLNARNRTTSVSGCLVRVDGGVACLQTWPELGDPALAEILEDFQGPRQLGVSRQAWACCKMDAAARRAGVHLLEGRTIPESHYTLPWGETSVPEGFHAVKVKAGPDVEELCRVLGALPAGLCIRLDFNEALAPASFLAMWGRLEAFHSRIEFVEDPTPYQLEVWRHLEADTGCRLAVDRYEKETPFLRVWKPARHEWMGTGDVVVTSNMDHPIGQVLAALRAATAGPGRRVTACGLVTHHLFDPSDPFVARMGPARAEFPRVPGTGLGFDDLLADLPWTPW